MLSFPSILSRWCLRCFPQGDPQGSGGEFHDGIAILCSPQPYIKFRELAFRFEVDDGQDGTEVGRFRYRVRRRWYSLRTRERRR